MDAKGKKRSYCEVLDDYKTDKDVCSEEEIQNIFPSKYSIHSTCKLGDPCSEESVCLKVVTNSLQSHLAVGTTSGDVHLIDLCKGKSFSLKHHVKDISDISFGENLLYTSSLDATIKCYDTRSNKVVSVYTETSQRSAPITCLDVSSSGTHLAAGTAFSDDGYILFWDVRSGNSLGCYTESHADEITTVRFHPSKNNCLLSGAMDNLINLYDISKKNEASAIRECVNLGMTPDAIYWDPLPEDSSNIFALSYPRNLQYWDVLDTDAIAKFTGESLCSAINRTDPNQCNFISCSFDVNSNAVIMGSSKREPTEPAAGCVRNLTYDRDSKTLKPHSLLDINSKDIQVTDGLYLAKSDVFVTIGINSIQFWGEPSSDYNMKFSELSLSKNLDTHTKKKIKL